MPRNTEYEKIDDVIAQYSETLQTQYRLFAAKVQDLLTNFLKINKIQIHSITSREKTPTTLKDKILRGSKSYDNPLTDITDLAGVRVITYFPTDVDRIIPIIEKEFTIDRENSIDKRKTADPSFFGYSSMHLVVCLSKDRLKLPEYALFSELKCEIQVRTILQHAWAEIEHDIVYKASSDIPFELRRKFASLAGLLEVADREFELLRQDEKRVRNEIKLTIDKENFEIPVDMESLRFYLEKYHNEKRIKPSSLGNFVGLLSANKVETIEALHRMLSKEALAKSDKKLQQTKFPCGSMSQTCLLRYALAISKNLNMTQKGISEYMKCPVLSGSLPPHSFSKKGFLDEMKIKYNK